MKHIKNEALEATLQLQKGRRGYRALWQHIMEVSVTDLKKNYAKLKVDFDLWKGEADADAYIPDMVKYLKDQRICVYGPGRPGGRCERGV